MELLPYIASYSAQSSAAIRRVLDNHALELVARVAEAPVPRVELDSALYDELIEMHVLREEQAWCAWRRPFSWKPISSELTPPRSSSAAR